MTKVVITGDMTFGESGPPPGGERPPRPSRPGGRPVDPNWGIEEGERPEIEPPEPPPGIWPPPSPGHPVQPLPPGRPGKPELPPGAIWPRPPGPVEGKFVALAHIPGHGWKYIVIDPSAWPERKPEHPIAPGEPGRPGQGLPPHPDQGGPGSPEREPKL
jgi:hypothetical protein